MTEINERYNRYLKIIIYLREGEFFCPQCKGRGMCLSGLYPSKYHLLKCSMCHGKGKLDWIDEIMGRVKQHA